MEFRNFREQHITSWTWTIPNKNSTKETCPERKFTLVLRGAKGRTLLFSMFPTNRKAKLGLVPNHGRIASVNKSKGGALSDLRVLLWQSPLV